MEQDAAVKYPRLSALIARCLELGADPADIREALEEVARMRRESGTAGGRDCPANQ